MSPGSVVLFAMPKAFVIECQVMGRDLDARYLAVRDLQAACKAIAAGKAEVVVASKRLPSWDREVVEEHARLASVPIEWIEPETVNDLRALVLAWSARARSPRSRSRSLRPTR